MVCLAVNDQSDLASQSEIHTKIVYKVDFRDYTTIPVSLNQISEIKKFFLPKVATKHEQKHTILANTVHNTNFIE